jgi:hypothetical protein
MEPTYYDYNQIPMSVADAAFADFMAQPGPREIFELADYLIKHSDNWCAEHQATSSEDNRIAVLKKLQAYLLETYSGELSRLMKDNIRRYREREAIKARFRERRN